MPISIGGFQKLSLIDFPETISSIVFTQGCSFRCGYCHNPDLIPFSESSLTEAKIFEYLEQNKKMLEGVCITGGEPTLQKDLIPFLEKIKEMGLKIKLDTNGIRPDVIEKIIAQKVVDYYAMDVKAPWEKYDAVVKSVFKDASQRCKETFHLISASGTAHEFRTTIMPGVHTKGDFLTMAGYLKDGEIYYIQQTQFKKTFDQTISQKIDFSIQELIQELEKTFPRICVNTR